METKDMGSGMLHVQSDCIALSQNTCFAASKVAIQHEVKV